MSEPDTPAWSVVLSQTDQSGLAYAHQQPSTIDELAFLVAAAEKNNTAVIAGSPGRIPPKTQLTSLVYAELSSFTKVIEYSVPDQVIHVESGIKLGDLRKLLAENKQWWPVYLPDQWTLLEALSYGDSGASEHRFSSIRDLVLGATVVTGHSASIIHLGGRVVKNVTGYDMTKLFVGSRSSLGLVVSAQLRLYAMPEVSSTLKYEMDNCAEAIKLAQELIQSGLPLYAVSISKDTASRNWNLLAQAAGVEAVVEELVTAASVISKKKPKRMLGEKDASVWRRLSSQFYDDPQATVQLVAPMSKLATVAPDLAALGDLEIRPLSGRVLVAGAALEAVEEVTVRHAQDSAPITVAGGNDLYNYIVHRLPSTAADATRAALQARLKAQFDPSNILNPFVFF